MFIKCKYAILAHLLRTMGFYDSNDSFYGIQWHPMASNEADDCSEALRQPVRWPAGRRAPGVRKPIRVP